MPSGDGGGGGVGGLGVGLQPSQALGGAQVELATPEVNPARDVAGA